MYWIVVLLVVLAVLMWCSCALWHKLSASRIEIGKLRVAIANARKETAEWAAKLDECETELSEIKANIPIQVIEFDKLKLDNATLEKENELLKYKLSRKPNKKHPEQ